MNGTAIAASLPQAAGAEREERLLAALETSTVHGWAKLLVAGSGHVIELEVSEDALRVGDATDSFRVNVTAATAERLAVRMDALLLTPKVTDLIHRAAKVVVRPQTQTPGPEMGTTASMLQHSRAVDAAVAATGTSGLASGVGKDWVLTNRLLGAPGRAANYGWHSSIRTPYAAVTGGGLFVFQPVGLAHNRFHVDYSQVWRGMRRTCLVDGAPRELEAVLRDPSLAHLLSHEGALASGVVREAVPALPEPMPTRDPVGSVPRVLRRGMQGADVAAWQRIVAVTDDGIFGPATESATRGLQQRHGLVVDGVVGPRTRAAAAEDGGVMVPFVQARNFGVGRTARVDVVVLHTMEAAETPVTAENVAAWFASTNAPMASAHYCVDADSVTQCVREGDTAFHAPGVNQRGIGIEHAGYARQTAEDWADPYSLTMLRRSAELVAGICKRHGIPVRALDEAALLRGDSGITTHAAVSKAFKRSTHTDPGPHFPMAEYLTMAHEYGR